MLGWAVGTSHAGEIGPCDTAPCPSSPALADAIEQSGTLEGCLRARDGSTDVAVQCSPPMLSLNLCANIHALNAFYTYHRHTH